MKLPIYKAISFNNIILKGGHSQPWVVSVNDNGKLKPYVVKLYKTIDIVARNKMTAEILGCLLAKEFDLITPAPAIIEFTDEFRMSLNLECENILNSKDERAKFGTEYYEGTFLFNPQSLLNESQFFSPDIIYAFDYFICNRDRNLRKPNLLIKDQSAILIDHELALEIDEKTISNFQQNIWDERYKYHLFYEFLKNQPLEIKNNYFKEFISYLEQLRFNKYNGIFEQLIDLGFTELKAKIIKNYFSLITNNTEKFRRILLQSIS